MSVHPVSFTAIINTIDTACGAWTWKRFAHGKRRQKVRQRQKEGPQQMQQEAPHQRVQQRPLHSNEVRMRKRDAEGTNGRENENRGSKRRLQMRDDAGEPQRDKRNQLAAAVLHRLPRTWW